MNKLLVSIIVCLICAGNAVAQTHPPEIMNDTIQPPSEPPPHPPSPPPAPPKKKPLLIVQEPAYLDYPGGYKGYFIDSLRYPDKAIEEGHEGTLVLQVIVDETGKITVEKIVQSSGYPELDSAAIHVVQNMPNWQPAIHIGQVVPHRFALPFEFTINEKHKRKK
ncbi:MAG: energy transducer TonB [Bacteroidota bacterium]|nr:energy transducer TonB [Bacteroidota bacterium]